MKLGSKHRWSINLIIPVTVAVTALAAASALRGGSGSSVTKKLSPFQVEVVSPLPGGFIPPAISRPPGPFLLVIRNYDHRADIAFNVPAADVALLPAQLLKSDDQWTSLVNLALGDHVLQGCGG
jgi:hypothetical protein